MGWLERPPHWRELDVRQPWKWPRRYQRSAKVLSLILGGALLAPFSSDAWQAWAEARSLQLSLSEQEHKTHALQNETATLQQAHISPAVQWGDVSALTTPASSQGLQWMQQSIALPKHAPALAAMQLQQVPAQLQARGSWRAWVQWLTQWPQLAPGAVLESLVMEVDGRDGVRADMTVFLTQHIPSSNLMPSTLAVESGAAAGPLDATRWMAMQQQHVQQHASYRQYVLPELRRVREPLEFFARERLHYVGQISKGSDVHALVQVTETDVGKARLDTLMPIHRVQVGAHVGEHFGRVSAITADALWLQELVFTPSGEWTHRDVQLSLQAQVP